MYIIIYTKILAMAQKHYCNEKFDWPRDEICQLVCANYYNNMIIIINNYLSFNGKYGSC